MAGGHSRLKPSQRRAFGNPGSFARRRRESRIPGWVWLALIVAGVAIAGMIGG